MIQRVRRQAGLWALAAVLGLAGAAPADAQNAPAAPALSPATRPAVARAELQQWVRDLSHPQFKKRDSASNRLSELPPEALPVLAELYDQLPGYEPRLRLRSAIERLFYRQQLQGRMGFLGVQPRVENNIFDPRLGKTVEVVFVSRALPDFPAAQAGVKTGDMLLELDGKPVGDIMGPAVPVQPVRQQINGVVHFVIPSPQIAAFTRNVSQREPGSKVRLRLLRADPSDRDLKLIVPQDPSRTLEGVDLLAVSIPQLQGPFQEMVGPLMRPGFCVTAVAPTAPAAAAGLKRGDVIVGLGRVPLPPNATVDQLKSLVDNSRPGSAVILTLGHLEQIELTVTLGGRPVDRMNPEDMEISRARFAEWWRRETGEASLLNPVEADSGVARPGTSLPDATVLP